MQQQSNDEPVLESATTAEQMLEQLGQDDVATMNLVGFFDVLIEMDLEYQANKQRGNENGKPDETSPDERIQRGPAL